MKHPTFLVGIRIVDKILLILMQSVAVEFVSSRKTFYMPYANWAKFLECNNGVQAK